MTDIKPEELRQELLIEQEINKRLDALVILATETMLIQTRMDRSRLEESQLRNLLNVSIEVPSIEVTANFIRYQIARKADDWGVKSDQFGHTVIKDLYGEVKRLADEVIEQVSKAFESSAKESIKRASTEQERTQIQTNLGSDLAAIQALHDEIYVRLTQLYLGYLNRTFYFYKKMKEKGTQSQQEAVKMLHDVVSHKRKQEAANAK